MNNNELNNNGNSNVYKATSNLNTAIENPQINVNSATGVNMRDSGYNNYADNSNSTNNTDFLNNSYSNQFDTSSQTLNNNVDTNINSSVDTNVNVNDYQPVYDNSNSGNYSYEPVMEEKKVEKGNAISDLFHSKEFKIIIFIAFILCLFLLVMPYIYDFFTNLRMIGAA